jgi:hypothetical protein
MNEAHPLLWVQALDVTTLITAAGCLLWAFHKEVEAIVFTQQPYPSARLIGGVIAVIGVLLMNAIGIVFATESWSWFVFMQFVLSVSAAVIREMEK